ncbi:proton-conducting transporter transmembrane domain-containing protein [Phenylobacterium sp.]|uniref:proton-conducting transporter transmembrane domain-containing protein n=1 Tax=Phenylobacterium sp. TaxID=1871053 RepID=UPI002FD87EB8
MSAALPLLTLLSSVATALIIFFLPDRMGMTRALINIGGALLKLALVALLLAGVASGQVYETRFELAPGFEFNLRVDALCLLFLTLSAFLWLLTTLYAIAYFGDAPGQSRFFGFFSLCVAATTGVALSGNLLTFFIFYELLTLSTWPLVTHKGDRASLAAGAKYLAYTLAGGALLLGAMVGLQSLAGPIDFARRDSLAGLDPLALTALFFVFIAGLGVKCALFPLHGWLPSAMVAPAPVSALLHAVAVVKAGAFGVIRLLYDVYGLELVQDLGVGLPLAALAAFTILYGSWRALSQGDIKRRLAFSTVSQVSYIILGAALVAPSATLGGLVHLVHQGMMKITLFFCAGALAERAKVTRVDQLDGIGRAMPVTMLAFSIAALGMIGAPPVAGFVSKWQLGVGGLEAGQPWVIFVLAASSLMNAAYFLPLIYRAWFLPPAADLPPRRERPLLLILPALVTALAALMAGLLAGMEMSPLGWSRLILERAYGA